MFLQGLNKKICSNFAKNTIFAKFKKAAKMADML